MPTQQRAGLADPRAGAQPAASWRPAAAVAGVVAVGLIATLVAARYSGAVDSPPGGITDAGPVVRWSLPLVRVVHDVAASLTIGSLLLAATMVPGRSRAESASLDEPRRA
ncbi:MAG: cytochrome C oxidase assembly protein, partial [Dermatophilaceae bacterium]|nr:cytochrome C oxidase assembly protein [Dermatophilaceae bacterium]